MTEGALQERVYLDTHVFIRAFEGTQDEAKDFRTLFKALRQNRNFSVTSELTLAELLAPADRKEAVPLHIKRRDGDAKRLPKSMTRLQPNKQGVQRVLDVLRG